MEMEVKDKFWYLDCGKKRLLFSDESEAIKRLKDIAKKGQGKADDLNLQQMDIKDDKMELKAISWQKIALELMK